MSDDEEKLEEKYEYIKQGSTIYVINEIQEDSGIEATIDDRKDQPYVEGSVVKVNKASQDVEVYIAELQKNIIVKFEQTLPLSNLQLLKKINNLTDYYPDLNYMDIFNVFKIRFNKKKYFTKIGQDLLVHLEAYHNKSNLFTDNNNFENSFNSYNNKDEMNSNSNKKQKYKKNKSENKLINNDYMNDSKISEVNKNLSDSQNSNQALKEDNYFDEFCENNQNEIYIFKGEMFSDKYILFEKLLCKLLPEHNISMIKIDDDEFINIENNNHFQENTTSNIYNQINMLNNNSIQGKASQSLTAENLTIDTKIYLCYKVLKFFGCIIENIEQNINNIQQASFDEENNINLSSRKEQTQSKINYKFLMRINLQYDKNRKVLGGEFLPILFTESNLSYILTHIIFYSIVTISSNEKLYHELYVQNMPHIKEYTSKGKKQLFVLSEKLKGIITKEFNINILIKYLSLLSFTEEEIKSILSICASIIFLNEINFKNSINTGNIILENEEFIHTISELLKIKEENLKSCLTMNMGDINGEMNSKFYKAKECEINKNLMAKMLYVSLFDWLVSKFNALIKTDTKLNTKNKINEHQRASMNSIDMYNKYRDENEIKDDEKEEEKDDEINDTDIKIEKMVISNNKLGKTAKDSLSYNLNNSNNEDKSKDDIFKDVYDIKNKRIIVENVPHKTSCLISPGFRYQYNEKFGLSTFLNNYINEKIIYSFSSIIYKRKLNELKEEGLEEEANNIPFSNSNNILELYEHESFNLLNIINEFCIEHSPNQINNDLMPLYTDLNTKFALNEQIKFGSRDNKDILIFQTEGQARYDLTQLIYENYNDIPFEIYKTLLSSSNNIISLVVLGILKEEEILNKKDNLTDEFVMSNGYPRKKTFIINILTNKLIKIFENIDSYNNEEKNKNVVNKYKFFLCFKSNNDLIKDMIYPRYLFNQLVYNDLLDVINFYKEQYEHEITYENFVYKVFKKVDYELSMNNKSNNEIISVNSSVNKINDIKQKTLKIINTLISFQVPKWFQTFDEIDLNAKNYAMGNTKIFLQSNFYNFLLYKMQALIENKRRSILKILAHFKGYFFRIKYQKFIQSILEIQKYFCKYKEKLKKEMYMKKVITLQAWFRAYKIRKKKNNLTKIQIIISKFFRGYKQKQQFHQIKKSVHILVPFIKSYLSFLMIKEHKDLKDFVYKIVHGAFDRIVLKKKIENSIKINAVIRRYLFQINHPKLIAQIKKTLKLKKLVKSAFIIQRYYRTYKTFKNFHYMKFAVDLIRGYWKMKKSVNHISELYNSIIPIQRKVKNYLSIKKTFEKILKNYMEQKYANYLSTENKRILHYFRVTQRDYLQKEGYLKKSKNGFKTIINLPSAKKIGNKSFNQKLLFFTEINDFDVYNSSILVYNDFWCEKFYKLIKIDKILFGENSSFMNIKISETYTTLLNSRGKVYTFGWNDNGQCNIDTVSSEHKSISSLVFSQIESCDKFSLLMNNKGELSKGFEKFHEIQFNGIASNHSDAIYAWKDNYFYKFQDYNINKSKININIKKNSAIKKIACGKNFVIFLSDVGVIYSYGSNSKGQLGLQDYKERKYPQVNELLVNDGERIIDISCGYKHVVALGCNGKAFTWGTNSNGQCGIDIAGNFNTPMYLDVKNKIKFIAICCGFRASFFMDDKRIIYFCGKSGIYNGENFHLKPLKNIIGETATLELLNNMHNIYNKKQSDSNNTNTNISRKTIRSSSTINIKKSNTNIISCLNKNIYPVKLNSTWNESFSIMYVTYADTTNLVNNAYKKELNKKNVKYILDKITYAWINDNINIRNVMKNYKDIIEYL